jgi:vanillate O-demethylase monooxygenase subunit
MFLKNAWYVAAWDNEVGRDLLQRWVIGQPVVLYRTEDGAAVALEDRCPHRRYALSEGTLIDDQIECNYHGLVFDCAGKCTRIPGQENIPPRMRVRTYPLVERWQFVWIWMGEPERADESLIPDFRWNSDPENWRPVCGTINMAADYRLLVDNLLDLTHETFVHKNTIGNFSVAETPMTFKVDAPNVHIERVMRDVPAPPLFEKVRGFKDNIDRWQIIRFDPPANIVIDARAVRTGTNDIDQGLRWHVINSITPENESSSRYFWSIARCFELESEMIDEMVEKQIIATFEEDKSVLETQHHLIETDDPDKRIYDINADAGAIAARRIVRDMIAEETPAGVS